MNAVEKKRATEMHLDVYQRRRQTASIAWSECVAASVCKLFNDDAFSMECISDCKNNLLAPVCGKMNDIHRGDRLMDEHFILSSSLVNVIGFNKIDFKSQCTDIAVRQNSTDFDFWRDNRQRFYSIFFFSLNFSLAWKVLGICHFKQF